MMVLTENSVPTSEWLPVTPALAVRWMETCKFTRQRNVRPQHVEMLANAIRRGEFEPGTIEFCHYGERAFLTDGQHRLAAIVQSDCTVEMNVLRRWVRSMEEVDLAYARTDRGLGRSLIDCSRAVDVAGQTHLTETQSRLLLSAVVPLLSGFESRAKAPDARSFDYRLSIARDWASEAAELFALCEGQSPVWARRLTTSIPMAIAMVTLRWAPEKARPFWSSLASIEGLVRGSPALALVTHLQNQRYTGAHTVRHSRAIAAAWNRHFDEEPLVLVKVVDESIARPLLLRGTPYKGKRVVTVQELAL